MTDFERYKYILDITGVKYDNYSYEAGMDIEIMRESIETNGDISIVFDTTGKFKCFEVCV
jgi:hypothetical protein